MRSQLLCSRLPRLAVSYQCPRLPPAPRRGPLNLESVSEAYGPHTPLGFVFDDLAQTWVPEIEPSTHLSLVRRILVSVVVSFSQFCFHQAVRMTFPLWGTLSRTTTRHQHHHKLLLCQTRLFHQPPSPRTCCRLAGYGHLRRSSELRKNQPPTRARQACLLQEGSFESRICSRGMLCSCWRLVLSDLRRPPEVLLRARLSLRWTRLCCTC